MAKFEAHLTFDRAHAPAVKEALAEPTSPLQGFKYSAFDADPVMGDKPYIYLTAYSKYPKILKTDMAAVSNWLEAKYGVETLRAKIERIIYDTKTGVNEILTT